VTGGLADDHVLAEFVRLVPLNGPTVSKLIIPYSVAGNTTATVAPSHSANGSVTISPFRAICGTRNSAAGAPVTGNITTDSDALANWRDIRSGVFVGSATTLTATIPLTPSAGVNPRWDLVYAAVTPDSSGPSVSRRVKNPSTGAIAVQNVPEYIATTVTVAAVTGTPGATPALPTLPADGAGIYYIPLAYVRIPTTFSGSTTILVTDIRDTTQNVSSFANMSESFDCGVANGNNDENTQFNPGSTTFPWLTASASLGRPAPWMPPDWRGGTMLVAQVDNVTGGTYSHANLAVVDSSIDWRKRLVTVIANYGTAIYGTDPTGTTPVSAVPDAPSTNTSIQFGSSFVASSAGVWGATIGGVTVALTVNQSNGNLCWSTTGSVGKRFAFMIFATGQMPNA
jgi:hypothetical protein